jgi:hypothetical protein
MRQKLLLPRVALALAFAIISAGVCLAQESHPGDDSAELRAIINDLNRQLRELSPDYKTNVATMNSNVDKLTALLDAGKLGKTETLAAVFYRARTRGAIGQTQWMHGEKMDTAMAQRIVDDMDKIIASDIDLPEWGVMNSEAEYIAGAMSLAPLGAPSRAYGYWEKCAEQGHAGCLNLMANARVTGDGGVKVDFKQALEYHSRVFATGTDYHCAGSESARSIAAIIYFTGVRRPDDDELEWLQKSYALTDKLQGAAINVTCGRFEAEVEEFLYRLARGERKDSILQDAAKVGPGLGMGPAVRKAVLDYLGGAESNDAFAATIAASKNDFDFCWANLYGLWYSELTRNRLQGKRYHLGLARSDHKCGLQLVYAKKFSLPASSESQPPAQRSR